jgi:phosphate transport system protein
MSEIKNMVDDTLTEINEDLLMMINDTKLAFEHAAKALHNADNKLAMKVIKNDDKINHLEETINYAVMIALAKYQPMATDLRRLIAAIKISNDIERIADYAKSIAHTAIINADKTFMTDQFLSSVDKMDTMIVKMLGQIEVSLKDLDVKKAYKIASASEELDGILNDALKSNPFSLIKEDNVESYIELMGVLRSLERARDHIKNVCESIIFVGNGTFVEL